MPINLSQIITDLSGEVLRIDYGDLDDVVAAQGHTRAEARAVAVAAVDAARTLAIAEGLTPDGNQYPADPPADGGGE